MEKVWNWLLHNPSALDKLDRKAPHVDIGPYTIQESVVYGLPPYTPGIPTTGEIYTNEVLAILKTVPGVKYKITRTGVYSGYGHGWETLELLNEDGSLIYRAKHIMYCKGPGSDCPYDHWPRYEYGEYKEGKE